MRSKSIAALLLAAMMVAPALGQDDAKKGKKGKKGEARSASAVLLKQLEVVGLTDDQVAKIKKLGEAVDNARKESGITAEIQKKIADAQKSMKDSELKGKERMAAVHKAAGLTDAQVAAVAKLNEVRMKMNKDVMAMLTDEQKEKLPDSLKRMANAGKGAAKKGGEKKPGAKKKKDAA